MLGVPLFTYTDVADIDASMVDAHTCGICLQLFTRPVQLEGCGHVFCFSCVLAWTRTQQQTHHCVRTCPIDRRAFSLASLTDLDNGFVLALRCRCVCGFDGLRSDHPPCACPSLACGAGTCAFVGHDDTDRILHREHCVWVGAACALCFEIATVPPSRHHHLVSERGPHNKRSCTHPTPLLDWSKSLKLGMSPTQLLNSLFPPASESQEPIMLFQDLASVPEIASFQCRAYKLEYGVAMALNLFHTHIRFPPIFMVDPDKSNLQFLFEERRGLRLIRVHLVPSCFARIESLRSFVLNDFLQSTDIPRKRPFSFSDKRPEVLVVVGRTVEFLEMVAQSKQKVGVHPDIIRTTASTAQAPVQNASMQALDTDDMESETEEQEKGAMSICFSDAMAGASWDIEISDMRVDWSGDAGCLTGVYFGWSNSDFVSERDEEEQEEEYEEENEDEDEDDHEDIESDAESGGSVRGIETGTKDGTNSYATDAGVGTEEY
ncbi:hypothetical protein BC830DRAFT_1078880 [Chytriomyces sp. MP71]|nr:hypothetical protein BC830DRAFT_1078880 [Chytriomyces sp. MP71]